MATDVNVYKTGGSFMNDLGPQVLPANVRPIDFSMLDQAFKAESDISGKALEVVMQNVDKLGKIQDELTGIQVANPYHANEIESAKKSLGIDQSALTQAANNIDNPVALFDMDRKLKRLSLDPRVKNAMYDNAILESFKAGLPNIPDPYLRARAIDDLETATNSDERNAIKNLNLDQYKQVDLEPAYIAALDQFAPYITTQETFTENGLVGVRNVSKRDPAMVAKTKEFFQKNPVVRNNLIARGYLDKDGNATGGWFDAIDAAQSKPIEQLTNVKGMAGQSGGGKYAYSVPSDLGGASFKSNVQTDSETGTEFDLGLISGVETSNRNSGQVVHVDPNGRGINLGAYSFHGGDGGPANSFLEFIKPSAETSLIGKEAYDELKAIPLNNIKNLNQAKAAYGKLEQALGTEALAKLEDQFAIQEFGRPIIDYIRSKEGFEDSKFTKGEATALMDMAIQWKPETWKKFINEYTKDESGMPIVEFMTKKRIEQAFKNANAGQYSPELAQQISDRAVRVWSAAMGMDNPEETATTASTQGPTPATTAAPGQTPSGPPDLTRFNQNIDEGLIEAKDSMNVDLHKKYDLKYSSVPK